MQNTLIPTTPPKKRIPVTEYLFNKLQKYPIPKEAIRYPKVTTTDGTFYNSSTAPTQIHDVINANTGSLVPNIDIGYQMSIDKNDLIDWINKTKEYMEAVNRDFQKKCEIKLSKLIKIEEQKEKSKVLNMDLVNKLPEDIIRHIYQYLLPETKIQLMKARYPNLGTNIMKLKNTELKKMSDNICRRYYNPVIETMYKYNRTRCLPISFHMKFSFTNKKTCIYNIDKLIGTYESAIPHTPSDHRYFQKKTLKIIQSLIYCAQKYRVLDKAYAPELEVPKPVKTKKARVKKPKTIINACANTNP
jgi:hypothetical protein